MRITYFIFICLMVISVTASAQDKCPVKFGKVTAQDFVLPKSDAIDSSAAAVIVADVGSTSFKGNSKGWFTLVFKRQVRIKIIDKKAFDLASDEISLYHSDKGIETIDKLEGSTYNLENGQVVETKLNSRDVFEEKSDLNYRTKKFTLPAVKEGSIIEYTYIVQSDFDFLLKSWTFQFNEYPCLWSEYTVTIPSLLIYMFTRQGYHPFYIDKSSEGVASYTIEQQTGGGITTMNRSLNVNTNTIKHQWVMKDLPAFNTETYLSSPSNYVDRVSFQLSKTYDGEQYHDAYSSSWAKATNDLLSLPDFGGSLKDNNTWIKDDVTRLVASNGDQLTTARNMYYYVQKNFTCTNHNEKYIKTTLKDLYKKKGGGVGEINLMLILMLQQAGITADPVLLSTRHYGFNNPRFPFLEKLNYVIVKTVVDGRSYYLDASQPLYGFGKLSSECYNGHARVISLNDSTSFYLTADSLKEVNITAVFINQNEKGELHGTWEARMGEDASHQLRERKSTSSQQNFMENYQKSLGTDMEISNLHFDSLDNMEAPISMRYDFKMKKTEEDIIYFNPMMGESIKTNPFKAAERNYPVEMPYLQDDLYVLTIQIPDGYIIDDFPKSARIGLANGEAKYEFLVEKTDTQLQLKRRLVFNKAYFGPDEYEVLRLSLIHI